METQAVDFQPHDIQLVDIELMLSHVEHMADSLADDQALRANWGDVQIGRSCLEPLSPEAPVKVALHVKIGYGIEAPLYRIEVLVVGHFMFNTETFDPPRVRNWAETNGYWLLLPFVREIVFGATKFLPSGPYFVPLVTLPPT